MPSSAIALCPACGMMLEPGTEWIIKPVCWDPWIREMLLSLWHIAHLDIPEERWIDIEIKCPNCNFNKEGRIWPSNFGGKSPDPYPEEMMTICRFNTCTRPVIDSDIDNRFWSGNAPPYMCRKHNLRTVLDLDFVLDAGLATDCLFCKGPLMPSDWALESWKLCHPNEEEPKAVLTCKRCTEGEWTVPTWIVSLLTYANVTVE